MSILEFLYLNSIFWLAIYGYHSLFMAWYRFAKYKAPARKKILSDNECPIVTIQLPLYNERYVAERLIDCVAKLDYPKNKMDIQVLDDSVDDTREIVQKTIARYQAKGLDIKQICRPERLGYKAGALKYGLESAKGEFITIFDADFLPDNELVLNIFCYICLLSLP